jgi:hypothetical protein
VRRTAVRRITEHQRGGKRGSGLRRLRAELTAQYQGRKAGFASRGKAAADATAIRTYLLLTDSAVAATACANQHTETLRKESTRRGGAAMPHALIRRNTDVGAEADPWLPTLFRFCAVHPVRSEQQ